MVKVRDKDFPTRKAKPVVDMTQVERAVSGIGTQVQEAVRSIKESLPPTSRVSKWDFDIERDRDGRLSKITAQAVEVQHVA